MPHDYQKIDPTETTTSTPYSIWSAEILDCDAHGNPTGQLRRVSLLDNDPAISEENIRKSLCLRFGEDMVVSVERVS